MLIYHIFYEILFYLQIIYKTYEMIRNISFQCYYILELSYHRYEYVLFDKLNGGKGRAGLIPLDIKIQVLHPV